MGIIIVIIFLVLSNWTIGALLRRLRREHVGTGWWVAFGILFGCGAAFGVWCAFYCEYHVGTEYRIGSFPIPVVFFHLEEGLWVDFPVPEFQAWSAMLANITTIIALAMLPLWLVSWRQQRMHIRRSGPTAPAGAGAV
jgi:hypothetical protein